MEPIGHLKSLFKFKNGTPRQAGVCSTARGILTINKSIFNNPEHSLEGLEEFSHAWIIFIFHKNNNASVKAKVRPPRLNGKRIGVFATRAPYRPNAIGLTLAKIEKISGAEIHFSGIDLLDGTPVLDVKPFIPQYDEPLCNSAPSESSCSVENSSSDDPGKGVDQLLETDLVSPFSQVETELDKQVQIDPVSSSSQKETNTHHLVRTDQQTNVNQLKRTDQMPSFSNDDQSLKTGQPTFLCQTLGSDSKTSAENNLSLSTDCLSVPITSPNSKRTYLTDPSLKDKDDTCSAAKHSFQTDVLVSSKSEDSNSSNLPEFHAAKFCAKDKNERSLYEDRLNPENDNSMSVSVQVNRNLTCKSCVNPAKQNPEIQTSNGQDQQLTKPTMTASWVTQAPVSKLTVIFTERAKEQLLKFAPDSDVPAFRLQFLQSKNEVHQAISDILAEDPRSIYRRNACKDSLYYFAVDSVHITCWFFDHFAEILFIQPASYVPQTRGDS